MPKSALITDPIVLQRFEAVAANLDGGANVKSNKLQLAIKDFDSEKRKVFLRWYAARKEDEHSKIAARQARMPPLTELAFLAALDAIKFSETETIHEFQSKISIVGHQPSPDPIILRLTDEHAFFFQPGTGCIYIYEDPELRGELHPYYIKFRTSSGYSTDLRAGIYLGPLMSCDKAITNRNEMIQRATETMFQVFLDPEDKSIWLVIARGGFEHFNETDFAEETAEFVSSLDRMNTLEREHIYVIRAKKFNHSLLTGKAVLEDDWNPGTTSEQLKIYRVALAEISSLIQTRGTD